MVSLLKIIVLLKDDTLLHPYIIISESKKQTLDIIKDAQNIKSTVEYNVVGKWKCPHYFY